MGSADDGAEGGALPPALAVALAAGREAPLPEERVAAWAAWLQAYRARWVAMRVRNGGDHSANRY